jgi:hypothetical protein
MKFLYVAVTSQGTAMAGTGLCENHFSTENIQSNLADPEAIQYVAVSENDEIECQFCGYKRPSTVGDPDARTKSDEEIKEAVEQGKREILESLGTAVSSRGDKMPLTLSTFSELHDYVDANEYAGLTTTRHDWTLGDSIEVQDRINDWLESGAHRIEKVAEWLYETYSTNRVAGWEDLATEEDEGRDLGDGFDLGTGERVGREPWLADAAELLNSFGMPDLEVER